jgi:hypothetical protein
MTKNYNGGNAVKKLIASFIFLISLILFPIKSKADTDLFLNLGVGLGIPAPVFVAPSPFYYAVPSYAQASLVSEISPNTFLSFSIGVPAPVFVAPAPVIVSPLYYSYPYYSYPSAVIIEPAPIFIYPRYYHFHPHGGPPGQLKRHVFYDYPRHQGYRIHSGHENFKVRNKHGHKHNHK